MNIQFDHVVHYVQDPLEAMTAFQLMGFHPVKGGSHDTWGTYNTLCYFKNLSYIEWIGISKLDVIKEGSHPFSRHIYEDYQLGEGFSQIAFRTNSIIETMKELSQKGIKTLGPFPGSRKQSDGTLLEWSMLFIEQKDPMPFFIEWGEDDSNREDNLISKGIFIPDNKAITYIYYSVSNPGIVANLWADLFNGTVQNSVLPGTQQNAMKVHLGSIDVFFSDEHQPRGEGPYLVGIEPGEGKVKSLHGGKYRV
ncbi:VOC family protein [Bacillus sinesaloumensis]|uniref:VOC family protein n=1 Tax=Litchfieldia sinesaloumensis TaxID=1926280 RepID=UPI0009885ECB|nr:VOC family protein [Bacillus sinesaloumensis]